ncbi:MAG: hypothetical protein HC887_01775 [Desulfobacteraceae bacterium]|nr:hypothetical protein [Desulfobacteraceae bacterium]
MMHPASESHEQIARAVQSLLSHYLKINVRLESKEFNDFLSATSGDKNPADMFQFGWSADYPDANNFLNETFHPFKSENRIGWSNKEFAELMDQAERGSDPKKRKAMYKRAEQILCEEEAAIVPIYFETVHCLVKSGIRNWYYMSIGGQRIRDWYLER